MDSCETNGDSLHRLSSKHLYALFDVLTHHEAYAEIEALKISSNIETFGDPLQTGIPASHTSSPLIQILLHKFILVLPGLRDVSPEFWSQRIPGLATALANANLSESCDKGSISIRRTLSTAIASMVECVSRGVLGGFSAGRSLPNRQYDTAKPEDVQAAWDQFLHQSITGDMLDRIFAKTSETDQLAEHESLVQAAHQYVLIMFVVSLHIHAHECLLMRLGSLRSCTTFS